MLSKLGDQNNLGWPSVDKDFLKSDENIIVIQITKRNTITITNEINESDLIEKIKEIKINEKYINNKEIIKTIYVKNKLINIIIK